VACLLSFACFAGLLRFVAWIGLEGVLAVAPFNEGTDPNLLSLSERDASALTILLVLFGLK